MAYLKVLQGATPGQVVEVQGEQFLLGRNPTCQVVLENPAVSRYHAQILQTHGSYYLEDLRSRNHTYLNGIEIEGRTEIHDRDELKVCDVVFRFYLKNPLTEPSSSSRPVGGDGSTSPTQELDPPPARDRDVDENDEPPEATNSSILSTLNAGGLSTHMRLGMQPEAKLRAVLEIARVLGQDSDIGDVMQRVLEILFRIYPQADEAFVEIVDENDKPRMIASHTRLPDDEVSGTSRTVIRKAMEERTAIRSNNMEGDFDGSQSVSDLKIRSAMCVPLIPHPPSDSAEENGAEPGDALGVIQINTRDISKGFSEEDLDVLISVAAQVVLAVQYDRMMAEAIRQREIQRDLEFAAQVQHGFLPKEPPKIDGYEFADHYEAAQDVGGDYFDYIQLPDGRLVVALGDVAGKGVPAALLMVRLHATARHHLLSSTSVGEALTGLNREISSSGMGHRFVTCVMAALDLERHTLTIANAGHLPPLVKSGDHVTELPRRSFGMPLGINPAQEYSEMTVDLGPGDSFSIFTDGITETMSGERELYGMKRLAECVRQSAIGAENTIKNILNDTEEFSGGIGQKDDTCIVVVQRLPA